MPHFFLCRLLFFVISRSLASSSLVLRFYSLVPFYFFIFLVNLLKCIYLIGGKATAAEHPTIIITNTIEENQRRIKEKLVRCTLAVSLFVHRAQHIKIAPGIICVLACFSLHVIITWYTHTHTYFRFTHTSKCVPRRSATTAANSRQIFLGFCWMFVNTKVHANSGHTFAEEQSISQWVWVAVDEPILRLFNISQCKQMTK